MPAETPPPVSLDRQIDELRDQLIILEGMFARLVAQKKITEARARAKLHALANTLAILRHLRTLPIKETVVPAALGQFPEPING